MIPVLYPADQTIFVGNGIGLLSEVISCKCTEKLNGSYELELKISRTSPHANDIDVNCTIKAKANYEDRYQLFRVYSVEKNYDDDIDVKAAHISYDTSGIPILPFTATNLDAAVDKLNTNRMLLSESPFVVNTELSVEGTLEVKSPTSLRSLLSGSDASITGVYGGEYHYDNYTINLVEKRGIDKGICFRWGTNISNFEHESNSENLYSAVLGFWKKSGNENQNDTIVYGNIIECKGVFSYDKIYILDTSNDIKNPNDAVATVDQIDDFVTQYIKKNAVGLPKNKIKIDYSDDDDVTEVCIGDRVGVWYPEYGIKAIARCNTVVFDSFHERNESIELGIDNKDISDSIAELYDK